MFCPKCGKENPDDANVCAQCGEKLKESSSSPAKDGKNLGFAILAGGGLLVVIAVLAMLIFGNSKINLNKYLVFEESGANGYGRVSIRFDEEKFVADNGKKFKLNSEVKKELAKWGFDAKEIAEYLEDYTSDYIAENFIYNVDIYYEYNTNLSNGDKVEYEIYVEDEALKYLDVKLKYKPGVYKVSGLEEVEKKDAFGNLSVEVEGTSPYNGNVYVSNNHGDSDFSEIAFKIESSYNSASNGDKYTVTITDDSIERNIKKNGVAPAATTKEFTISGLPERVSKVDQINKEAMDYMISEANDYLTAYVAKNWGDNEEVVSFEHVGTWVATPKKGSGYNKVFLAFDLKVHFEDESYDLDKTETITWFIEFDNLYLTDGKVDMSKTRYSTARDYGNSVYWCKSDGEKGGSCWDRYYYYGHENIDAFIKARINSLVDNYVIDSKN